MQINVSGQQIEITDALRTYVTEKIARIQKHFDHVTNTNVVLHHEKKKNRHLAEATLNTKGAQLHANSEGDDMYAVIDALADKLDRQVLRHKEKISNHR